jgi:hypothetical protein
MLDCGCARSRRRRFARFPESGIKLFLRHGGDLLEARGFVLVELELGKGRVLRLFFRSALHSLAALRHVAQQLAALALRARGHCRARPCNLAIQSWMSKSPLDIHA